jgi:hypothetical protein
VVCAMKFHVAREGAVMREFEEQIFRNKVFSGEIRPNDLYWTAGFTGWRPVSEFRVARKPNRSCWIPAPPCHRRPEVRVNGRRRRLR